MALFNESEQELIDAARMILSDGVRRLTSRTPLLPNNRTQSRQERETLSQAREAITLHLIASYGALPYETACAVLMDPQGRLLAIEEFPRGKATSVELSPRMLATFVLKHEAACVLLAHNHPSGDASPSRQDVTFTKEVGNWLKVMEVDLIDHLVLTAGEAGSIMGKW